MKVECPSDALLIVNAAVQSHVEHWEKINNALDYLMRFKKPVDEKENENRLQSWMSNWNYGKGRSIIEKGVISNITDIFKSLGMIELTFNAFDKKKHKKKIYEFLQNEQLKYTLQYRIASLFCTILEQDPRIHTYLAKIEFNSFTFGYCPIIRDRFTYLGKPVSLDAVAFEDRTLIDKIKNFVIFDVIKGDIILERLNFCKENFKEELEFYNCDRGEPYHIYPNGWIKEGMEEVFINCLNGNEELKEEYGKQEGYKKEDFKVTSWEDVEEIKNQKGQTWLYLNTNNIYIVKVITYNDGKYTETYQVVNGELNKLGSSIGGGTNRFMLYQKEYKVTADNFINIITEFGITESDYIQSLRGISKQLVEESLRYDFKKNAIEDKLLLGGNLNLTTPDGLSAEASQIQVYGGVNFIPEGVQFVPNQIKMDLSDHVESIRTDEVEFDKRTSHYNPQIQLSNRPTKDEVQLQGAQHQSDKNAKLPFKLADYSRLFKIVLSDLINEEYQDVDKEIQNRFFSILELELEEFNLKKDDIKLILNEIDTIVLNPVNTDINAIKTAMPFAQNTIGRTRLTRSLLYALGFNRNDVNTFIEVVDYGDQVEKAALENSAFYNTMEVVFDESQDHISHLQIHFPKLDRIVKGIAGGEDIVRGFNYITNSLPNCEKHVAALENSFFYKNRFKEFEQILKYFQSKSREIALLIEEQKKRMQQQAAEGQQQNGQIPPEELAKIKILEFKAMEKEKRTNAQWQMSQQRRVRDLEDKLEQRKRLTDSTIEEKKALTQMQTEIEQLKQSIKLANA